MNCCFNVPNWGTPRIFPEVCTAFQIPDLPLTPPKKLNHIRFVDVNYRYMFISQVWPGLTAFPDFTYSVTQAYWEQMLSQFRNLVEYDGLWIDMNEPSNQLDGSPNGCPADSPLDHPPYATHVSGTNLYSKTVCMSAKHHDYSHYDVHSLYGLTEMEKTMR